MKDQRARSSSKNTQKSLRCLAVALGLGLGLSLGTEGFGAEGESFVYGGPCEQLAQLSPAELDAVVHPAHASEFGLFCRSSGPLGCSDYRSHLGGRGQLEEAEEGQCALSLGAKP